MEENKYAFEDLEVWQIAVKFAEEAIKLADKVNIDRRHYRLIEQLESASTSIALNIAEGKGRYSKKEFVQFLYIARGSLYEVITLLMVFRNIKWISSEQFLIMKERGSQIGKMLSALINHIKKTI